MKVLSGAERPDAGDLRLDGVPFTPDGPLDARRGGVATIYQELSLADHLTVELNVSLGVEPARLGWVRTAAARERARDALERMGHPELDLDMPVRRLGVAERQVVETARAVASGCRVLVLDEPTSSLGRADVERLFRLVRRLREGGCAVVYVSHFLEEVKEISDRFTVLRDGRVAGEGETPAVSTEDLVGRMIGRRLEQLYPRSERQPDEIVLSARDLAGVHKPLTASFDLRRGEVLGVAGLVGAGRTELLRLLFSLDRVRRGEIRIGVYAGPAAPHERLAQGVGLLSEDRQGEGLALALTLADNLTLSRLGDLGPVGLVLPARQQAAAAGWIERLGIRCRSAGDTARQLSGGNQQKLALARLLRHDVDVLLLDEPTRGIDVGSKAQIYRIVDDLARGDAAAGRRPKAILMVSSYLPELLGVCDRIAVMSRGVLGEPKPTSGWTESDLLLAASGRAAA
jgi:ribose transport system ATP-binding protein